MNEKWNVEKSGVFKVVEVGKINQYCDRRGWHANQHLILRAKNGTEFKFTATENGRGHNHFNCRHVGDKLKLQQGAHFVSTKPPMPAHSHVGTTIEGQYSSGGLKKA